MGRLIPFIILILLVLGMLIGLPFFLQPDGHRAQLTQYLSDKLHHKVVISKLDAGFLPPALRIHDFAVLKDGEDAPLYRVEEIDVTPDWSAALQLKFLPSAITLNHGLFNIPRRPDGSWDFAEWSAPLGQVASASHWPLKSVAVHQGEVDWVDNFAPVAQAVKMQLIEGSVDLALSQTKFTATLNGFAAPISVDWNGKGHLTSMAEVSGQMKLTDQGRVWTLDVQGQNDGFDAKGQASEWRAAQVWAMLAFYARWKSDTSSSASVLSDWKNHFTVSAGSATFYESGHWSGGVTEVKGDLAPSGDQSRLALAIAMQDVPIEEIAQLTGAPLQLDGKLTTISRLQVPLSTQPWANLDGQGAADVKDGHLRLSADTIKTLSKAHTMAYFNAKFPDLAQSGVPFKRMHVQFKATQGTITLDSVSMDAGEIKAALVGKLDAPKRGIDAYARIRITETDSTLRSKIPAHYRQSGAAINGRVQGNWTEWSARAISASRIPVSEQNALRRALTP